jgi:hypothetical protein
MAEQENPAGQVKSLPGNAEFTHEFFEASSAAWTANKIRRGPMMLYKCAYKRFGKSKCTRGCFKGKAYCSIHSTTSQARTNPFGLDELPTTN